MKSRKQIVAQKSSLLFEIGVEELPAEFVDLGANQLAELAKKRLAEEGQWDWDALNVWSTPRRLVLSVTGLAAKPAADEEILGPALSVAYDASGKPTAALTGFLKSRNGTLKDVYTKESPRGPRVALRVTRKREPLTVSLPALMSMLAFPKAMRWIGQDGIGLTFPRPIRWVLALLDRKVIRFKAGHLTSDAYTYGHRFLAPGRAHVASADPVAYRALLRKKSVWLSQEERSDYIRTCLKKFKTNNEDETLIATTANLVEVPFAVEGKFRKAYLDLPPAVLSTCMARNQKIFCCYDAGDRAVNRFVAILNGPRANKKAIAREYERVLEARLSDARLFFEEDQKKDLPGRQEQLKQLAFLGRVGTVYDKQKRVADVGARLIPFSEISEFSKEEFALAAHLAKADLTTQMVYEFPDLQGVIGSVYAARGGVKAEVAAAIGDHYWPKSLKETLHPKRPIGALGAWLGVMDRIDTLVGALGSGFEISSSQDPFALRRAAGGVVKIISECFRHDIARIRFSLRESVDAFHAAYGTLLKLDATAVYGKLKQVIEERVIGELWNGEDIHLKELLEAVMRISSDHVLAWIERYQDLKTMYAKDRALFLRAAKVVERTHNILKGARQKVGDQIDQALLAQGVERELFGKLKHAGARFNAQIEKRCYGEATRVYAEDFYDIIHKYFDEVLVNAEEEAVWRNRHALMKKINQLYTDCIADLSCLTPIGDA